MEVLLPFDMYPNGGVSPSLSVNPNIPTSGSIDLTDYLSGHRIVAPSVSNVALIYQAEIQVIGQIQLQQLIKDFMYLIIQLLVVHLIKIMLNY